MGLKQVRALLRRYEARRSRSRVVLASLSAGAMALAACLAVATPMSVLRVGQVLLAAGLAISFWQSWRKLAQAPPGDDVAACAAFLRARLVARRDAALGGWLWRVAPLAPGMAVILTGLAFTVHERWPSLAPMMAIIVAWLGMMFLIMRREQAKTEAELAELDKLVRG
jgi:hypothetical protein